METHFNVIIASQRFEGLGKVKQHQLVYSELSDIMKKIHALTLTTYPTPPDNPKGWSLGCFHNKK